MTQKQKDILLKDLCGRLSYGVMVYIRSWEPREMEYFDGVDTLYSIDGDGYIKTTNEEYYFNPEEVKPYLFPMSSMTEEQQKEYRRVCDLDMTILENRPMKGEPFPAMFNSQDWLDAHHFDYRGLIPMGLAIDATGKNIY